MAGGAARSDRGGEGTDAAQRRTGAATRRRCRGSGSTRTIGSRPMKAAPRWRTCSEGARSSWSTTSCSGPTTRRAARPARRSRTASTASPCTWPTTTSRSRRCRGRRWRSCRPTSSGWGGRFPGRPRTAATSTSTSTSRFTEEQQRDGRIEYNYRRERPRDGRGAGDPAACRASSRPRAAPMRPPTRATGRA